MLVRDLDLARRGAECVEGGCADEGEVEDHVLQFLWEGLDAIVECDCGGRHGGGSCG